MALQNSTSDARHDVCLQQSCTRKRSSDTELKQLVFIKERYFKIECSPIPINLKADVMLIFFWLYLSHQGKKLHCSTPLKLWY